MSPFKGKAPGSTATPKFAATTSGPKFTTWGAGMGFTFNNPGAKACPYNASAYKGIKFWAKSNTTAIALKAMLKIPGTTPTTADSGTCVASTTVKCEDHFYLKPAPMLTHDVDAVRPRVRKRTPKMALAPWSHSTRRISSPCNSRSQ